MTFNMPNLRSFNFFSIKKITSVLTFLIFSLALPLGLAEHANAVSCYNGTVTSNNFCVTASANWSGVSGEAISNFAGYGIGNTSDSYVALKTSSGEWDGYATWAACPSTFSSGQGWPGGGTGTSLKPAFDASSGLRSNKSYLPVRMCNGTVNLTGYPSIKGASGNSTTISVVYITGTTNVSNTNARTNGALNNLPTNASSAITILPGTATQISVTRAASGAVTNTAFTTQPQITIQDSSSNTVNSSAVVTATISTGATLVGTATATASSGVATFTNLGVSGTIGTAYTITYTITVPSSITNTQSITPAAPAASQYLVTSSSYAPVAGRTVTITAQLADIAGNAVATAGKSITWTKSNSSGSFATATSTTNSSGVATVVFTAHNVASTSTTITATSSSPTLTGTSSTITTVLAPAVAPTISSQPSSATSTYGATATFTVVASITDGGTLSYQWKVSTDGGANYANVSGGSGSTTSSYTTPTLLMSDHNKNYLVIVTNTFNGTEATATSNAAALTVNKATQAALTITFTTKPHITGTLTLVTSGGTSGGAISYLVSNTSNTSGCSISESLLSATTIGSCLVTATMAGGDNYNDVASSATLITITASNNASMSIVFSVGTVSITDSSNLQTLKVSVSENVSSITFTPTLSSQYASVTLGGIAITTTPAGTTSVSAQTKNLVSGLNSFNFVVTAEDGTTVVTYAILVTRAVLTSKSTAVTTPIATSTSVFKVAATRSPKITGSPSPASAAIGAQITLTGSGFTGTKSVKLGTVNAPIFTVVSDTQIRFTIPVGAVTSSATVTNSAGSATSGRITVTP